MRKEARGFFGVLEWVPSGAADQAQMPPNSRIWSAPNYRLLLSVDESVEVSQSNGGELICLRGAGAQGRARRLTLTLREARLEGELCEITGDFALMTWSSALERVVLARDIAGSVPLYFLRAQDRVVFSTDFGWITAFSKKQLDRSVLISYVVSSEDVSRSVFDDIEKVPPGNFALCTRNGTTVLPYWSSEGVQPLQLHSDREYEERLRGLVHESVVSRTSGARFACELSGGWDSSCLAASASELVTRPGPLLCYTHTYRNSPTANETHFSDAVSRHLSAHSVQFDESCYPPLSAIEESGRLISYPSPFSCHHDLFRAVDRQCGMDEVRAVISGQGGDHLFLSQDAYFPVFAATGGRGLSDSLRHIVQWSLYFRTPIWRLAWDNVVTPLLPSAMLRACTPRGLECPSWLGSDAIAHHYDQIRRWNRAAIRIGFGRARRLQLFENAVALVAAAYHGELLTSAFMTYPYLDRRVAEFLLGVPSGQLTRPNEWRSLQKRSFGGMLPIEVMRRTGKRGSGEAVMRAVSRRWDLLSRWFSDSRCADLGHH